MLITANLNAVVKPGPDQQIPAPLSRLLAQTEAATLLRCFHCASKRFSTRPARNCFSHAQLETDARTPRIETWSKRALSGCHPKRVENPQKVSNPEETKWIERFPDSLGERRRHRIYLHSQTISPA